MEFVPTHLALRSDGALEITWSDGPIQAIPPGALQAACPCATCREKAQGERAASVASPLGIVSAAEPAGPSIVAMTPVGNYAYSIRFDHGCSRGIYTFEWLRAIGDAVPR